MSFALRSQHNRKTNQLAQTSTPLKQSFASNEAPLLSKFVKSLVGAAVTTIQARGAEMPGTLGASAPTTRRVELVKGRLVPDCNHCLQHAHGGGQRIMEHYHQQVTDGTLRPRVGDVECEELGHSGNKLRVAVHVLVAIP